MKKIFILTGFSVILIIFTECGSTKQASSTTTAGAAKYSYANNIQTLVATKCTPCHIPSKGGNKKAFDAHEAVKDNIDSILYRINLNPGDKGFMPFKRPKLSQDTIAIFSEWKATGMQ
jgi:hypothetical protein